MQTSNLAGASRLFSACALSAVLVCAQDAVRPELRLHWPDSLGVSEAHVPVQFVIPASMAARLPEDLQLVDGREQVVTPLQLSMLASGDMLASCVLPSAGGEATARYGLLAGAPLPSRFRYVTTSDARTLHVDGRPRIRHERRYDAADHEATFKHFDTVLGLDGELLTKMAGGKFSHHRGIFVGWNRVRHEGATYDFWHSPRGETLAFDSDLGSREHAGPHMARRVISCSWKNGSGRVLVRETRSLDVWSPEAGRLVVDLDVQLTSVDGRVELGGDPHHGGVQIRLANEIAGREKSTRYLRPSTAVTAKNDNWKQCDWAAIVVEVAGKRWAVLHQTLSMPAPWRYSTRPYGRFGSFCTTTLEEGTPARFRVRLEFFDLARCAFDATRAARLFELAKHPVRAEVSF